MHVVKAVLLRSVVGPAVVVIAAVATALSIANITPGVRLWADLVTGLSSSSVFTGLITVGAAAVEANRWRSSHRTRHASAARRRWSVQSLHASAVIVPLALGFWVGVVALSFFAAAEHSYGTPSIAWLVSLFCALVLAGTVGYVLGAVLPGRWFVGPAAALVFYVGYVLLLAFHAPAGVLALFPASSNFDSVFVRPVVKTFLAQAAFYLAASFLLVFLIAVGAKFSRRSWLVLLSGVAAAAVAGGVVISTNGLITTGHNPGVYACSGVRPTLCLNPGYSLASNALHREFADFNARAAGTNLVAIRLEQNLEGNEDLPSPGSRTVYLEQWASRTDLTYAVSRYVELYGGLSRCGSNASNSEESSVVEGEVNIWLSGYNPVYGEADPAVTRLQRQSLLGGNAWFRQHYAGYAACTLTSKDLP